MKLLNDAPAAVEPWGPDSTDPDRNTAKLREKVQKLVKRAPNAENAGLAMLLIKSTGPGRNIRVRPNVLADLPAAVTGEQRQGLTIQGGGKLSTVFEVVPSGTPAEPFYLFDGPVYDTAGVYARVVGRDFGMCLDGESLDSALSLDPTIDDAAAPALWKHARFCRLSNWAKDYEFENVYVQGARTVLYCDGTYNGDRSHCRRVYLKSCGTAIHTENLQSMNHTWEDCEASDTYRDLIYLGEAGGGGIQWNGGYISTNSNMTLAGARHARFYLVQFHPSNGTDCSVGKVTMTNARCELRGRLMGILRDVPLQSQEGVQEDIGPEQRERTTIFNQVTWSAMNAGLGTNEGGGRVAIKVGVNKRGVFNDCHFAPRTAFNQRGGNRDYLIAQLVMDDRLVADGGSLSKSDSNRPPELIFNDCGGSRNFFRNHIEYVRDDDENDTPNARTGRVSIQGYRPEVQTERFLSDWSSDLWAEDGEWGYMSGTVSAGRSDPVEYPLDDGLISVPGNTPAALPRLFLPPCYLSGGLLWLAAYPSAGTDSAHWQIVDPNGNDLVATGDAQADAEHFAANFDGQAPVIVDHAANEAAVIVTCTSGGTVNDHDREHLALVRYRGLRFNNALGAASPAADIYRSGYPYSRELLDRLAYHWPLDEGDDLVGGGSDSAKDYGFNQTRKVIAAAGGTPGKTSDGSLGRSVRTFSGSGARFALTGTTFPYFDLADPFTVFALIYYEDNDSAVDFAWRFKVDDDNQIYLGPRTSSSNEQLRLLIEAGGVTYGPWDVAASSGAWLETMFRRNASGWQLFIGGSGPVAAGSGGELALAGTPTEAYLGGGNGANIMNGRLSQVAVAVNHYASDEDYEFFRTGLHVFPRDTG